MSPLDSSPAWVLAHANGGRMSPPGSALAWVPPHVEAMQLEAA